MQKKLAPIGMFDSGIGGTSIFKEIHKLLPLEQVIYLADSKNAPYGAKSQQEIIDLSIKNTELLLEMGAKIIVVACNTATTNAIKVLREKYSTPIVGIEPAIKPAALNSKNKTIGILATKGTLASELFIKTSDLYTRGTKVIEVVGEGLVPLIETGNLQQPALKQLVKKLVTPMLKENIDYLVLGCSHYPYLMPILNEIVPQHVQIIDSGRAAAQQTKNVLEKLNLLRKDSGEKCIFYSNKNPRIIEKILQSEERFLVGYKDF
ncbi:glutamate racemase [Mesonia sp. HuA40]|uniref:glutamate racemase n=1 Tax=Mesonia sp. HuA40 TaxID=2602761 RepID=UPI0011CAABE2|nr:glutamate racemase [Mesonia sp. HuA40]TXK73266.1 glutamate racemase [Mesonia sp. HuA40]